MLHRLIYQQNDAYYAQWTQSFVHSLGVFCSGGTVANITALWVARNRLLGPRGGFAGVAEEGLPAALRQLGVDGLAVLVSRRGHYSLGKAADLLGLGRRNLLPIPVDRPPQDRHRRPARARSSGCASGRWASWPSWGSPAPPRRATSTPSTQLADVAAEHGAHFHVDAAWGGPTLFSRRHRPPAGRHRAGRLGHHRRPQAALRAGGRGHGAVQGRAGAGLGRAPRQLRHPPGLARHRQAHPRGDPLGHGHAGALGPADHRQAGLRAADRSGHRHGPPVRGDDPARPPTSSW